ncbi:MAG: YigZ family protein [Bacilli bacterium]|nr:YigZ family protein [Bacilli bacterium]MDD4298552.1 YigZ family protein [Bacilli bacterium]MDD4643578.1 YigZ family protein [Bacilli bacterium]
MKTIKVKIEHELIVKKSKFIALLYHITSEEQAIDIISAVKGEYKNASHYCYAYIINNIKRSSDDGEPSGTAGIPILSVLEKNDLDRILCVVVRYFGGIKLGAGGLIRSYGKCVREALETTELVNIYKCYKVSISFTYEDLKDIDFIINKVSIIKKDFGDNIKYIILLKEDEVNIIERLKLANAELIEVKEDYYFE